MSENGYVPPYTISDKTVNLISGIAEIITEITIQDNMNPNPRLRRDNRIKTIHASLAIENNSLSLDQVTDIFNGKRILGAPAEICEVKNAFEAYEKLLRLNPFLQDDMLATHNILMKELTIEAGIFRSGGVGIYAGKELIHMAPPANRVPILMNELMNWVEREEVHPLIKSSVFHYEFEFIHPFTDGNGRMGRMWQTLLLYQWKPLFGWLPIDTLIQERQDEYYKVLGECDNTADSGKFVEFILQAMFDVLTEISRTVQVTEQVKKLLEVLGSKELTTKELMAKVGLKHRPTFRNNYLLPALELGIVEMTLPDKPNSSNQKYKRKGLLPGRNHTR
jgi:Fic family protein